MASLEHVSSAPGLALQALLRAAKPAVLRKLIGSSIVEVLEGLNPELLTGDRLGNFAATLIEPSEALRTPDTRDQIIGLLPLPKARELAARFNVEDGKDLYAKLRQAASTDAALPTLFSFFGVVRDERAPTDTPPSTGSVSPAYGLFDHQRVAAAKVVRALSEPPRKVVLHMPTGSGKTRTAMHIVAEHLNQNQPTIVCWLSQSAELLEQSAAEFELAWYHLGNRPVDLLRFWGHRNPDVKAAKDGLIVGGLGKMYAFDNRDPAAMLCLADRASLTVIDEAHQAIAPTYAAILTALHTKRSTNALLGLTATPGRTWSDIAEDKKLSDYFDNRKVTLEIEGFDDPVTFLIEAGYLARPTFRTLNSEAGLALSESDVRELADSIDVPDRILERLGEDAQRNLKIINAVKDLATRHRRMIVFAPSVANARLLAALLSAQGLDASVVTGHTNTAERERMIRSFKSSANRPMVMVNFGVLTTGFDAPATSAAVIARPTRSLVLYSQMVGRATRGPRAGGNAEAEIVTVADPHLPGFGSVADAFKNWEDVWHEPGRGNATT
jgi:superfamily II DNA or RNA helicase